MRARTLSVHGFLKPHFTMNPSHFLHWRTSQGPWDANPMVGKILRRLVCAMRSYGTWKSRYSSFKLAHGSFNQKAVSLNEES